VFNGTPFRLHQQRKGVVLQGEKLAFNLSCRALQFAENSVARRVAPSAAKAITENKAFIAAVNRCATQNNSKTSCSAICLVRRA
jgi:hypothetical protein